MREKRCPACGFRPPTHDMRCWASWKARAEAAEKERDELRELGPNGPTGLDYLHVKRRAEESEKVRKILRELLDDYGENVTGPNSARAWWDRVEEALASLAPKKEGEGE